MIFCTVKRAALMVWQDTQIYGQGYMYHYRRKKYNPLRYLICETKFIRVTPVEIFIGNQAMYQIESEA